MLPFGEELRTLREAAGLSQDGLAERARLSSDAIGALERGTRVRPYPATVRALADALGLSPKERAALAAAVPRRSKSPAGSARGHDRRRGGLPVPGTPLLGRNDDVAAVAELLAPPSRRLVTLTGTGGIGKTRLAVAVAEQVGAASGEAAVFVALAPVLDEASVWPELGRALAVGSAGGPLGAEEVLDAAEPLQVLLVLDNCEHLPGMSGIVTELLERCPGMRVLATSRAPLRLRSETEYLVPPLRLPEPSETDPTSLADSPAASLLVERGRAVRRDLVVRPGDVPALARICHRVAGVPLALELAAVGLRVLDPEALLARLDEVLTRDGPVDLPARQRTMRATLDWSYGLLSERDAAAFRRLSVFVGGFTLPAAEAVIGESDVFGSIERLVAQSLCVATAGEDGAYRYGMLEPVAQYGRSLLNGNEEAAARLAHAQYLVEFAERAEQGLHGSESLTSLRLLDAEEGNVWSALDWAAWGGRPDLAARLIWALMVYWWIRGRGERARRAIEQVLTLDVDDALRARVLHAAAALGDQQLLSVETVERLYLESLALAERCGDRAVEGPTAIGAGLMALERGDSITAERRLRQGLSASLASGNRASWNAGLAHTWLATVRRFQGDAAGAVSHAREAIAIAARRGDPLSRCIALYDLAHAELDLGQRDSAREHLVEALALCQQTRDATNLSYVLDALASVELAFGGRERVVALLGAGEAVRGLASSAVYRWYTPDVALKRRTAEEVRRELGEDAYRTALDAGLALTFDGAIEFARQNPTNG